MIERASAAVEFAIRYWWPWHSSRAALSTSVVRRHLP